MDLKKALSMLIAQFDAHNVPYAIIGGFAIGALGIPRSTIDLDFLVSSEALHKVDPIMLSLGYKKVFASENASQYVSPSAEMGEVDFLHAFRPLSVKMLAEAQAVPVFGRQARVMVLKPEDLIALKLQSLTNNPAREAKDSADIEELCKLPALDWARLEPYFELFGMQDRFKILHGKYAEK
ncbi:MAG: nucleotidyltransferase family protein [Elusimicrobiales bacterium]